MKRKGEHQDDATNQHQGEREVDVIIAGPKEKDQDAGDELATTSNDRQPEPVLARILAKQQIQEVILVRNEDDFAVIVRDLLTTHFALLRALEGARGLLNYCTTYVKNSQVKHLVG